MKHTSTTHRIDLAPAQRFDHRKGRSVGIGESLMTYEGSPIGSSRQPLYDAARYLLDHALASPADRIVTYRGNTPCLAGVVGQAARVTIREDDRRGLYVAPFKPFDPALRRPREGSDGSAAAAPQAA